MTIGLLLSLAGLALVDSTSIGTLGIPIFLMLTPNRRPIMRLLVYLGTIVLCYFLLGIGLMLGLNTALGSISSALAGETGYWIEAVVGVGLFILSFRFDPKRKKKRQKDRALSNSSSNSGSLSDGALSEAGQIEEDRPKWMNRLNGGNRSMITLGLLASAAEAATMVPYLAAVGIMTTAQLPAVQWIPLMAGYSVVMVLPALALVAVRAVAGQKVQTGLEKAGAWIQKNSASALGWVLGIAGFLLARDGIAHLFFTN